MDRAFKLTGICLGLLLGAGAAAQAQEQPRYPFKDGPAPAWASDAVRRLAQRGIFTGYVDETFGGKRAISRYEAAVGFQRFGQEFERLISGTRRSLPPGPAGPAGPPGAAGPTGPTGLPGTSGAAPPELKGLLEGQDLLRQDVDDLRRLMESLGEQLHRLRGEVGDLREQSDQVLQRSRSLRHKLWERWLGALAP